MKKLLLGGVAAVALSTAVGAVEMTPSAEAPPPPPAEAPQFNWTGAYGRTNQLAPSAESLMLGTPIGSPAHDARSGSAACPSGQCRRKSHHAQCRPVAGGKT